MNSMREIFDFVGISGPNKYVISQGAYEAVTPDPNMNWVGFLVPQPTMRWVGRMIPVLSDRERTSMKAMIQGLQKLPPISLEADAKDIVGEIPFNPEIHVSASTGVIYETTQTYFRDGRELSVGYGKNLGASEGTFSGVTIDDLGNYVIEVRRTGVAGTGITTLRKSFDIIARAPPAPPPPPPPDPIPPFISVQSKGDGSFLVDGKGFLPESTVYILVGDKSFTPPITLKVTSNPSGEFKGFPTGNICNRLATRVFIANDGRLKPSNHSQLVSNTVELTCPA